MTTRTFTAIYQKRDKHYIAWIEEIPGVNAQGKTKKEVKESLAEALQLIMAANRTLSFNRTKDILQRELIEIALPA